MLHSLHSEGMQGSIKRCLTAELKASYSIPIKNLNDSRRRLVDNYFRDFNKKLSITELSELIGTGTRQLGRIIKEYYSITLKEKLIKTRMEHARMLLHKYDLPLRSIAGKTGFSSENTFNRVFKKSLGHLQENSGI
jgi:transcriptional regulator GlxA family with amidase domain